MQDDKEDVKSNQYGKEPYGWDSLKDSHCRIVRCICGRMLAPLCKAG